MKNIDLTRAWKDPLYRAKLNSNELSALPDNPAGIMEVTDDDLTAVSGGTTPTTIICSIISVSVTVTLVICTKLPCGPNDPQHPHPPPRPRVDGGEPDTLETSF